MLSAREYVEIMTTRRLNRKRSDDRQVSEREFLDVKNRLNNLIYKMSHTNKVVGFDSSDLEGFFLMKIHQILRENKKYNNELSYFARAFQNVVRNLIREQENTEEKLYKDPIQDCVFFNEIDKLF